ncbi:hypothetical protein LINPERPRIM_LOCUS38894 [Linum perenne]
MKTPKSSKPRFMSGLCRDDDEVRPDDNEFWLVKAKYGGGGNEAEEGGRTGGVDGLNLIDKVLEVGGARISYNLWEFDDEF